MEPNKPKGQQPVMDVQRPAPPAGDTSPGIIQPSSDSLSRPATMEYTRPRPDGDGPDFSGPATNIPPAGPSDNSTKKPKKSKKVLVFTLTVLVILAIAGAGAYFYMAYKQETPAPVAETPVIAPVEETVQATPDGVDQTIDKVDQSLNALDESTLGENDLSDDSLGL